jgi:hypothetical protein
MSIAESVGESALKRMGKSASRGLGKGFRKGAVGLALGGFALQGLSSGIGKGASGGGGFYDVTLGDPNADQQILGAKVSPMNLMAPLPFSSMSILEGRTLGPTVSAPTAAISGAVLGGGIAAVGATALMKSGFKEASALGKVRRGAIGLGITAAAAGLGAISGMMGGTATGRKIMAGRKTGLLNANAVNMRKYANQAPQVDGSIAFGMYNARQGG